MPSKLKTAGIATLVGILSYMSGCHAGHKSGTLQPPAVIQPVKDLNKDKYVDAVGVYPGGHSVDYLGTRGGVLIRRDILEQNAIQLQSDEDLVIKYARGITGVTVDKNGKIGINYTSAPEPVAQAPQPVKPKRPVEDEEEE